MAESQDLESNDFDANGQLLKPAFVLHGNMPTGRDVYSAKCDYVGSFDEKWKLEVGVKSNYADVKNGAFF